MGASATDRRETTRTRVSRGTLNRDEILRATVELIEEDPGQPITMKRVANALGTRPMSLYTHVRNRDDLVDGAVDRSLRAWTVEVPRSAGWELTVRAWCRSLGEHARRYSPLIWEMSRNGRFQPALLEKVAILARSLRRAGLEGRVLADALRWIPQTVLGAVVLELSRPAHLQSIDDEAAAIYGSLARLDAPARAEFMDVLPYFSDQSLDDLFEYSIDRIIDGVRSQSAAARNTGKKAT
jgi:TetR/AcrR family tetracycline transcriptional repressor